MAGADNKILVWESVDLWGMCLSDIFDQQIGDDKPAGREFRDLRGKVKAETLQCRSKVCVSCPDFLQIAGIDVNCVNGLVLFGADVFQSVSASDAKNHHTVCRKSTQLLSHHFI